MDEGNLSTCKAPGCARKLRRDNQSGYCPAHHYFTVLKLSGKVCAEPGCGNPLRGTNASGFCPDHRYLASRTGIEVRRCAKVDCGRPLRSDNTTGYCRDHTHLGDYVPQSRHCACGARLGNANKSGLCGACFNRTYANEHREAARTRMEAYRARQAGKLTEAERLKLFARELEDKHRQLELRAQGQAATVRAEVHALIPRFEQLFATAEDARPAIFSAEELEASRLAIINRAFRRTRALSAARWLVGARRRLSIETIRDYCKD